jgi:hypothetical protein
MAYFRTIEATKGGAITVNFDNVEYIEDRGADTHHYRLHFMSGGTLDIVIADIQKVKNEANKR